MTLTKLEVAVSQLNQAIHLFLNGEYLSSLTLSGAAEEILGQLCKRAGKPVSIEAIIAFHWTNTAPDLPDNERKKILLEVMNRARNAVKHANDPSETHFIVERDFPLQMIMRAMPMARSLGLPPSGEADMKRWIDSNSAAMGGG